MGYRIEANLDDSGFGGFSTMGLGDGSIKSQCKEHGSKWVDVVKGGEAMVPPFDPKEGIPAVDEDPNSLSPGDAVMAQEVLVDNLIVSIGSKAVEREELSEKILSVLEHQEMDHVTLNYHSFN
ncbi:hypothetical protein V6N13_143717 [Hibiscus sabdariffa]